MGFNSLLFGNGDIFDIGLKIISGIAGLIGLSFAIYVVFLKRKWKKDEEYAREKEENKRLELEGKLATFKSEFQLPFQTIESATERLTKLEKSLSEFVDEKNFVLYKYNIDTDISELKNEIKNFKEVCTQRHDRIVAHGSFPDLKARVDSIARKIDGLEDFRHHSADRYVLTANYQQDTRMITDIIGVLRDDLRIVMEMVDKL